MAHVVDYEEFTALTKRLEKLEADYNLVLSLLSGQQWLSRVQAMKALKCSDKTLKRLTHPDKLVFRYQGNKPYYDINSIRNYLAGQKIGDSEIDYRVLSAANS